VKNGERPSDDREFVEAGSNLRAEVLAEHVAKVVSAWPPLTREQIDRVAAVLRGGGDHAA
jgi:hypothetical protein